MLNGKLKKIAEIALIGGIPEIVKDAKPGRARNLSIAVERATQRMLGRIPEIGNDEKQMIYDTMSEFGRVTGWGCPGEPGRCCFIFLCFQSFLLLHLHNLLLGHMI